jgi:hypothetical protein
MREAVMARANLAGANLTDAELSKVRMSGADLTGARLEGARITRKETAPACPVCGSSLESDGSCKSCQSQELGTLILSRRSQPVYLALFLCLVAGPLNFVLTPLFAASTERAWLSAEQVFNAGWTGGIVLSVLAFLIGVLTSRRNEGRERRLMAANNFLAGVNILVLGGVLAAFWFLGAHP